MKSSRRQRELLEFAMDLLDGTFNGCPYIPRSEYNTRQPNPKIVAKQKDWERKKKSAEERKAKSEKEFASLATED